MQTDMHLFQKLIRGSIFVGLILGTYLTLNTIMVQHVQAACQSGYTCEGDCEQIGTCSSTGNTCIAIRVPIPPTYSTFNNVIRPVGAACGGGEGAALFGRVHIPFGILQYNYMSGSLSNIGVIAFANTLLLLFFSVCLIWFMFNLIYVGIQYLSSQGDTKVFDKLKEALLYPSIGLVVLAASFLIVSLIGSFIYGNPSYILQPQLPTVTQQSP